MFRGIVAGFVVAVLLSVLLIAVGVGRADGSVSQFRVVVTGDSILRLSEGPILAADGVFADLEDGRQPYEVGTSGRLSSAEAIRLYVPLVEPGGWFVFQDNGAGASLFEWRWMLEELVHSLPVDRCLLGVLPVWVAPASAATVADSAAKANIMVQVFGQHPCVDYVRWNQKVEAAPSLVYDGQHPTGLGAAWLAGDLLGRVVDLEDDVVSASWVACSAGGCAAGL